MNLCCGASSRAWRFSREPVFAYQLLQPRCAATIRSWPRASSKACSSAPSRLRNAPGNWAAANTMYSLSSWRRRGQLEGLVLRPPPTKVPQLGILALWRRIEPSTELLAKLRVQRGIDRVIEGPGSDEWPWRLTVVLRATPQLGAEPWRDRLATAGLTAAPDSSVPLRIEEPRDQALLFNT